jgi:hypothetical protein
MWSPHFHISRVLLGVEPLDDFVGEVEPRVHVGKAGFGREDHVEALLLRDLLDDRDQPLLELALQVVLKIVDLRLGALSGVLDVALQLVDLLVELAARRFAHDRCAGVALGRQRRQLLLLVGDFPLLLLAQRLQPLRRLLAGRRIRRDLLDVDEGVLRVLRERRRRLRLRRCRLRGHGRRGRRRRGGRLLSRGRRLSE